MLTRTFRETLSGGRRIIPFRKPRKGRDVVYDQLASIVAMPESYALCPENPHFADELREKNVGLGRGGDRAVFTIRDHQLYVLCVQSSSERPLRHGDLKD